MPLPEALGSRPFTTAEALDFLKEEKSRYDTLRDVVLSFSRNGDLPSPRSLGMRLNALRGRVIAGQMFQSREGGRGALAWIVKPAKRGTNETNGTDSGYPAHEERSDKAGEEERTPGRATGNSPASPVSPARSAVTYTDPEVADVDFDVYGEAS